MNHRTHLFPWLALIFLAACGPEMMSSSALTCDDIRCDNAACEMVCPAGADCTREEDKLPVCTTCNAGYEGSGQRCDDIDECAIGAHDCPALCVNTPGSFTCGTPGTCAELNALMPDAGDDLYTLYWQGNPEQPWTAYCHDMAGTPREYLSLVMTGADSNVSRYRATLDGRTGKDITTHYTHIQIDPKTLNVDAGDSTLTASVGQTTYNEKTVSVLPYGVAMSCDRFSASSANVDLSGLPFILNYTRIVPGFCEGGIISNYSVEPYPAPEIDPRTKIIELKAEGACGWVSPEPSCGNNPLDLATQGKLGLKYEPYTRTVFVTSEVYSSDFGGIEGANARCQERAIAAGLDGTIEAPRRYEAWLGAPGQSPSSRFIHHQVRYILVDGTVVADSWNDLTDGTLKHPINLTELGESPAADTADCSTVQDTAVWTAAPASGGEYGSDWSCSGWSGTGGRIALGSYDRSTSGWTDACRVEAAEGNDICMGQLAHLYCFEVDAEPL